MISCGAICSTTNLFPEPNHAWFCRTCTVMYEAEVVIIGGGAAGFFAAAQLAEMRPGTRILMLEKTGKVLAKVRISGGGRCNVTHNCHDLETLCSRYPRGKDWLMPIFQSFAVKETVDWFRAKGVQIKGEADGRMFPATNTSQTIIDCLYQAATQNPGFRVQLHAGVHAVKGHTRGGYAIEYQGGTVWAPNVLVTTGGFPSATGFSFLKELEIPVVEPVPSLFTFNTRPHPWQNLQGVSVPDADIKLPGTDFSFRGPLLVTHWGFSGPAVLKLSAFAARHLARKQYRYNFEINFLPANQKQETVDQLLQYQANNPRKSPVSDAPFMLPRNLYLQLCQEAGLHKYHNWAEAGKKSFRLLADCIHGRRFEAEGKTTYKDEFVTAGGVDLAVVQADRCESRTHPGLFFAGEVLDIDGITGGFNFQAAWSTATVAARAMAQNSASLTMAP